MSEPLKQVAEPMRVSTFINNFTSIFLEDLRDLADKLEADQGQEKKDRIVQWAKDAKNLVKYSLSVLSFPKGNYAVFNKFDVLC